jgi:putative tryptophan/tyrosine transport system substrate-binding protein
MKRREFIAGLGGAVAWPLAARAQQAAAPVIGFLHQSTPAGYAPFVAAFHQGLGQSGYVEGRNLAIEYRWAENHLDRLPAMAADLVRRRVAVIATAATPAALAAKAATATIPIVFTSGVDPIKSGLIASFNRPGGNVTGTITYTASLNTKELELLHEVVPNAAVIGFLVDTDSPVTAVYLAAMQEAARSIGQQIRVLSVASHEQFDEAFTTVGRERIGALVVASSALFISGRERLVALAARHGVAAIYGHREFVAPGGLMSYGISNADSYRQIGVYVGRILKGEKPGDLPVVQSSTKFELVINLKTAKALGLTIPETLLATADEVIQ